MREGIVLFFLTGNTWLDLKKREISFLSAVILTGIGGLLMWIRKDPLTEHLVPLAIAGMFWFLSIVSEGKLGMGDAWILVALSTMLEMQLYLCVLFIGLIMASIWSGFLLVVCGKKKTTEIPFLPFLLAGYLGGLCLC